MNEPAPILTPAQVQEIEMNFDSKLVRTHWGECWKCHPECAIARLVASHRALERIVDDNAQCCEERRKAEADATRLRGLLAALVEQVEKSHVVDDHGHVLTNLKALRDAQQALAGKEE